MPKQSSPERGMSWGVDGYGVKHYCCDLCLLILHKGTSAGHGHDIEQAETKLKEKGCNCV